MSAVDDVPAITACGVDTIVYVRICMYICECVCVCVCVCVRIHTYIYI